MSVTQWYTIYILNYLNILQTKNSMYYNIPDAMLRHTSKKENMIKL